MSLKSLELDHFVLREACPSCGSGNRAVRSQSTVFPLSEPFPEGRISLGSGVENERRLYDCKTCGLWYYSHVPSKSSLRSLLDQPQLAARWAPTDRRGFRAARDAMHRFLPGPGRVLDVGAHTGGFLDSVGPEWSRVALDPMSNSSSKIADREIAVINSFLEDADLPASSFDCISLFDVFEHLYSPDAAAERIAHALKPGGITIIETGTTRSVGARLLGAGWYYLSLLEHFQAFSERSLRHLFERNGFEVLLSEKVFHESHNWNEVVFQSLKFSIFSPLTIGGQPHAWRFLWRHLRPTATATPPITGYLEPDHSYMVFRKV